jgi:hypothetical protein
MKMEYKKAEMKEKEREWLWNIGLDEGIFAV